MSGADNQVLYDLAVRATDLMKDRRWHEHEHIVRELMKVVPPGPAVRRNESDRAASYRQMHRELGPDEPVPPRKRPLSREKQIEAGQRSLVREFLSSNVFESYPKSTAGRQVQNKVIRMLHPHRLVNADWKGDRIRELEQEVAGLKRRLERYEPTTARHERHHSERSRPGGPDHDPGLGPAGDRADGPGDLRLRRR